MASADRQSAEAVPLLAELEAFAIDVFGSEEAARGWLEVNHPLMGGPPLDVASTRDGARRVREILIAAKYGGVV